MTRVRTAGQIVLGSVLLAIAIAAIDVAILHSDLLVIGDVALIWLSPGLALAVLIRYGRWLSPGVYAGSVLGTALHVALHNQGAGAAPEPAAALPWDRTMLAAGLTALADIGGTWLGATLLRRARGARGLRSVRRMLRFLLVAGVLMPLLNAVVSVPIIAALGFIPAAAVGGLLLDWASAEAVGLVAVAPLLLSLRPGWLRRVPVLELPGRRLRRTGQPPDPAVPPPALRSLLHRLTHLSGLTLLLLGGGVVTLLGFTTYREAAGVPVAVVLAIGLPTLLAVAFTGGVRLAAASILVAVLATSVAAAHGVTPFAIEGGAQAAAGFEFILLGVAAFTHVAAALSEDRRLVIAGLEHSQRRLDEQRARLAWITGRLRSDTMREEAALARSLEERTGECLADAQRAVLLARQAVTDRKAPAETRAGGDSAETGQKQEPAADPIALLERAEAQLGRAVQRSLAVASNLSPGILGSLGLEPTLALMARRLGEEHGLTVTSSVEAPVPLEPGETERGRAEASLSTSPSGRVTLEGFLVRTAGELLNNIIKHAGATEAGIDVRLDAGTAELTVWDNGRGFPPAPPEKRTGERRAAGGGAESVPESFGLFSIEEQARARGGGLRVLDGDHTQVRVRVKR